MATKTPVTKLAAIMRDEGRTATWLARRAGMRLSTLTRTIRGEREPDLAQAYAIAAALRRPVTDVFDVAHEPMSSVAN